jgi:hypothetical protein
MIWDANLFHMEKPNANEKERVVGFRISDIKVPTLSKSM